MDKIPDHEDLTVGSIPRHIRRIATPTSIGFFFHTMYNVVDTYFAGLLSTEALAALALSFPFFFLIIATASGFGTGATALIANALGAGNRSLARHYIVQTLVYGVAVSLVLTAVGIKLAPTLFVLFGASGMYLENAVTFMRVIFLGSVSFVIVNTLNAGLNAQGITKPFRNFLTCGFLINCILDPWLMYGGFGVPRLGIAGIALATVIAESLGVFYLAWVVMHTKLLERESFADWRPRLNSYWEITRQALPAGLNMLTIAAGIFVITYFVSIFGTVAVAAYGISTRIEQIALLPVIGINVATLALVGQNNGAGNFQRVRETYRTAVRYVVLITTCGSIMVYIFAELISRLFSTDPEVIHISVQSLHISLFAFWAYAILFVSVSTLQGLKQPLYAIAIGVFRQIVGLGAILFLYVRIFEWQISGVWWGVFSINVFAALITLLYTNLQLRKLQC